MIKKSDNCWLLPIKVLTSYVEYLRNLVLCLTVVTTIYLKVLESIKRMVQMQGTESGEEFCWLQRTLLKMSKLEVQSKT
ncbi:hypothetical protein PROFUN_04843 [Planoprotostelium fungivorum]|uniref:Uncharacterized protein n=1 Tax=Planoprotostelium fungivorum TaxID=1890364 RepID=A0A2P6NF16_9EUKA|nr:hypothetical protein PROFUN_04843 [Planoprotostelium fungivorum]